MDKTSYYLQQLENKIGELVKQKLGEDILKLLNEFEKENKHDPDAVRASGAVFAKFNLPLPEDENIEIPEEKNKDSTTQRRDSRNSRNPSENTQTKEEEIRKKVNEIFELRSKIPMRILMLFAANLKKDPNINPNKMTVKQITTGLDSSASKIKEAVKKLKDAKILLPHIKNERYYVETGKKSKRVIVRGYYVCAKGVIEEVQKEYE